MEYLAIQEQEGAEGLVLCRSGDVFLDSQGFEPLASVFWNCRIFRITMEKGRKGGFRLTLVR